jgi:hypothetical protein
MARPAMIILGKLFKFTPIFECLITNCKGKNCNKAIR